MVTETKQTPETLVGVVTGGIKGIGLGIAAALAKRGARVAVTYRSDDRAAEAARDHLESLCGNHGGILLLKGDVGDPAVVTSHYEEVNKTLGAPHVLVNNAGVMPQQAFDTITDHDWEETIRINLSGAFYWCARALPAMKALGFGRIVNIASVAARGGGVIGPHYAASKAGLLGLTRYAARELGPSGVTVNAINPAFIEDAGIFAEWSEEKKEGLRSKVVVPRLGNVEDVVRAFEYLLDSPFITGVALDVNGGSFMI